MIKTHLPGRMGVDVVLQIISILMWINFDPPWCKLFISPPIYPHFAPDHLPDNMGEHTPTKTPPQHGGLRFLSSITPEALPAPRYLKLPLPYGSRGLISTPITRSVLSIMMGTEVNHSNLEHVKTIT